MSRWKVRRLFVLHVAPSSWAKWMKERCVEAGLFLRIWLVSWM